MTDISDNREPPAVPISVPSEPTTLNLAERFALKEAVVRLRQELETTTRSADYPYAHVNISDVAMALDEIDRLMLVNGQIAKMWCDSEDRIAPAVPISVEREPTMSDKEQQVKIGGERIGLWTLMHAINRMQDRCWETCHEYGEEGESDIWSVVERSGSPNDLSWKTITTARSLVALLRKVGAPCVR